MLKSKANLLLCSRHTTVRVTNRKQTEKVMSWLLRKRKGFKGMLWGSYLRKWMSEGCDTLLGTLKSGRNKLIFQVLLRNRRNGWWWWLGWCWLCKWRPAETTRSLRGAFPIGMGSWTTFVKQEQSSGTWSLYTASFEIAWPSVIPADERRMDRTRATQS